MKVSDGWVLECIECGSQSTSDASSFTCSRCNNLLQLVKKGRRLSKRDLFGAGDGNSVWRFRRALPIAPRTKPITLGEGSTPLIRTTKLSEEFGLSSLFVKNEGQNPTGSFKDRGMTVSVTRAVESGAKLLICASTGNTSASLSAYASRAGMKAVVVIPSGKVALGKLTQAVVYGAVITRVEGNFDEALAITIQTVSELPFVYMMNSVNPYRIEGQKTIAFEVYQQLGFNVPDYIVLPVGNAGNISAIWKGFKEMREWGLIRRLPTLIGVQAAGAAPIVDLYERSLEELVPVENPETVASAIRIGNPASWKKAVRAISESRGLALSVTDDEILQARNRLASKEGIFVEPASATPIAALKKLKGKIEREALVVCIGTGNGLKDQDSVRWNPADTQLINRSALAEFLKKLAGRVS